LAGPPPGEHGGPWFLSFLVLVLAFLTASFPARNNDVWFHLATGRLLAEGQFSFGDDPFAYTTGQVYWANHSWLFDLGLYELQGLVGGTGLVVLKALLVTVLAWLLLRVRRDGTWLPALCTTLAVLAMSPRLLLQPACVSYFLLGLTFWLLWRPHVQPQEGSRRKKEATAFGLRWPPSAWVLVVFVLWVNVDEWFLLGPVLTALFWLGERLQGQRRTPLWLVPAGLAVCLLNPYTFHAFTLPSQFAEAVWGSGLRQDVRFQALIASPWQPKFLHAAARLNAAHLAYFVLTGLGLLSFVLHRQALRGWRLTVWLPFALLAAWQTRAIPFFAVVAAPVTALNLQDFLAGRRQAAVSAPAVLLGALAGRFVLVLGLLALLLLTWPGWLAGIGREGAHVAWEIQAEPTLRRTAETLHAWRRRGLLPGGERVLALSPEVAQYGAWFAPGERHFFDQRFQLFAGVAEDYAAVCRALLPGLVPDGAEEPARDWRRVLRDHRVGIVVFYDQDRSQRLSAVLGRLAGDPGHWTLLQVTGRAVIAGWNEARPPGAFAPLAFDAERLALGRQDERARQALPAAPEQGPEKLPPRRDFWARLASPPAPSSWESDAATVYLHDFEASKAVELQRRHRSYLSAFAASLAGQPAQSSAVPQVALQVFLARTFLAQAGKGESLVPVRDLGPFLAPLVEQSPALPLLAVRAARRAVAANPEDGNAWLRLGQAYQRLRDDTCERSGEGLLPPLVLLRHVQIATALEQAVRLNPDLEDAHRGLAFLYGGANYLDLALEHRRQELRLTRRAGRRPAENDDEFADRLEFLEKDTAKLEQLVEDHRQRYAAVSRQLQGDRLRKAAVALELGLARLTLEDILLPTPADLLGEAGMRLELNLLLSQGRVEDVRAILNDPALRAKKIGLGSQDIPAPPGLNRGPLYPFPYVWPAYDWLHVLQSAAVGDYARAREDLRSLHAERRVGRERLRQQQRTFNRRVLALVPGLLSGPSPFWPAYTARGLGYLLAERAALQTGEPILRAQQADLYVLEGLLALEQGSPAAARSAFTRAQQLCAQPPGPSVPFAGGPIAAGYLGKMTR
jgi:hypothetical protein